MGHLEQQHRKGSAWRQAAATPFAVMLGSVSSASFTCRTHQKAQLPSIFPLLPTCCVFIRKDQAVHFRGSQRIVSSTSFTTTLSRPRTSTSSVLWALIFRKALANPRATCLANPFNILSFDLHTVVTSWTPHCQRLQQVRQEHKFFLADTSELAARNDICLESPLLQSQPGPPSTPSCFCKVAPNRMVSSFCSLPSTG